MKPFVRVRDKRTGHQYDVHRDAFNPDHHERLKRVPDSWAPRRAKPRVTPRPKTPATEAGNEGDRPTGD